eukprot:m.52603 g.52603  ORF g.52603 m.52603 type:complete len:424 (+) comp10802_c0_seq3:108-1379(+)
MDKEGLLAAGKTQGDKIRALKESKAPKDEITKEVEQLLAIKAKYKEVTGEDYPAPNKGPSKKKKKGGEEPVKPIEDSVKKTAPASATTQPTKPSQATTRSAEERAALMKPVQTGGGCMTANCMYRLQSYHDDYPIAGAQTMYSLPPIAEISGGEEDVPPEIRALERRQIRILKNLDELITKAENEIKKRTGGILPPLQGEQSGTPMPTSKVTTVPEICISSHPESPALATFIVLHLIAAEGKEIDIRQYWHSSVCDHALRPTAAALQQERGKEKKPCFLRVRLTWKDVEQPTVMLSPGQQVSISGDGNVCKFLARTFHPALYSEDHIIATKIDQVIDTCWTISNSKGQALKMATKELKDVNVDLGKNEFVLGSQMSLADIALYSCMAQNEEKKKGNIKKLCEKLETIPAFAEGITVGQNFLSS